MSQHGPREQRNPRWRGDGRAAGVTRHRRRVFAIRALLQAVLPFFAGLQQPYVERSCTSRPLRCAPGAHMNHASRCYCVFAAVARSDLACPRGSFCKLTAETAAHSNAPSGSAWTSYTTQEVLVPSSSTLPSVLCAPPGARARSPPASAAPAGARPKAPFWAGAILNRLSTSSFEGKPHHQSR